MAQKLKHLQAYRQSETVEPGLFQLFRTYMIFFDVVILFNIVFMIIENQTPNHPVYYSALGFLGVLTFLLFNKRLQKKVGPTLLAICIVLYTLTSTAFFWGELTTYQPADTFEWMQVYFRFAFTTLFIPYLITVWQFGFRGTLAFLGLITLLEVGIFLLVLDDMMLIYSIGFIIFRTGNYFIIGLIISRLMLAQRRQRYELEMANQQLTHYATTLEQLSVSRERNRLARELHDTLAHTLSGVSVQLEAVRTLWDPRPEDAKAMLNQALSDTRNGLTDTRRALEDLRAEPLEDLGLNLAIEQLCHAFNERTSIETELELPDELALSAAAQNCIYRTVQEALTNIDRHAAAKHVKVQLALIEDDAITLSIQDDGIGFDTHSHPEEGHFGLRGMRERAELIGGRCEVISAPSEGTAINLYLKKEDA